MKYTLAHNCVNLGSTRDDKSVMFIVSITRLDVVAPRTPKFAVLLDSLGGLVFVVQIYKKGELFRTLKFSA